VKYLRREHKQMLAPVISAANFKCCVYIACHFSHHSQTRYPNMWEPGSSGSIVSDYGLDDRTIGVRFLAGAKDCSSSLCVQTGSGAHPASCTMGTGGTFPGGKSAAERDADHSPPSSAEVENE
jgi:hypothetical protein